jgi:hypothetical protein
MHYTLLHFISSSLILYYPSISKWVHKYSLLPDLWTCMINSLSPYVDSNGPPIIPSLNLLRYLTPITGTVRCVLSSTARRLLNAGHGGKPYFSLCWFVEDVRQAESSRKGSSQTYTIKTQKPGRKGNPGRCSM